MAEAPKGLGESPKQQFKLLRETVELPSTRKELVQRFEMIVAQGGVQRVLVQLGRAIEVDRFIPADGENLPDIEEMPSDDLLDRVRNGDLRHLNTAESDGALHSLLFAFQAIEEAKGSPVALYVSSEKSYSNWLKIKGVPNKKIFGVEVRVSQGVPEDAAILVGLTDDSAVGVRIPVPEYQKASAVTARRAKAQGVLK